MLFKTFVFAAIATFAATVGADCTTGKILGKFAICGSDPVDCGSGLCCQSGATCVSDDGSGVFRCAMPLLSIDPTSSTNETVLLNAGCYDTVAKKTTASSTASSSIASSTGASSSGQSQASSQNTLSKSKLSKGAIAGIVVGSVVVGLILLAILVALLLLARRRRNNTSPAAAATHSEMGERSNSSNSGLQKPAPAVLGDRSSTAKPRPISPTVVSRDS